MQSGFSLALCVASAIGVSQTRTRTTTTSTDGQTFIEYISDGPKRDAEGRLSSKAGFTDAIGKRYYDSLMLNISNQAACRDDIVVFSGDEYESQSGYCKLEQIWAKILEDETMERWYIGGDFNDLFTQDMNLSYDHVGDDMPPNRVKMTHSRGVVTKVQVIPAQNQPYTGMFNGAHHCIMRISETTQTTISKTQTNPGYGLKCLVDGKPSANMLTMHKLEGQKSYNFFANRWTTQPDVFKGECAVETIGKKLSEVSLHLEATSVLDWATFKEDGSEEVSPHWPFEVQAEPYDVYGWTTEYEADFQDQLDKIPVHQLMFKLFTTDVCPEWDHSEERLVGYIVARSETRTSFWGDTQLFFKHQRIDDDIRRRPQYTSWVNTWTNGEFSLDTLIDPPPTQRCPFFFLFEQYDIAE